MERLRRLWTAPTFADEAKTGMAGLLHTMLLASLAALLIYGVVLVVSFPHALPALGLVGVTVLWDLAVLILLRQGNVRTSRALFASGMWAFVTGEALLSGGVRGPSLFGYVVVTCFASLLLGGKGGYLFAGMSVLAGLGMLWIEQWGALPLPLVPSLPIGQWAALSIYVIVAATVLGAVTNLLKRALGRAGRSEQALREGHQELAALQASLQEAVAERTRHLRAAARLSEMVSSLPDPEAIIWQAVDLIREQFDLLFVGVFLVDESAKWTGEANRWAVLRAAAGDGGQDLLDEGRRVEVGGTSPVSWSIAHRQVRIVQNAGRGRRHWLSPHLSEAQSELALPLARGERVLGALTVQSRSLDAFDEPQIEALQTMTDQIASAIENARLYAATQEALARADRAIQLYVQTSWERLIEAGEIPQGYRYTPAASGPDDGAWLPPMADAVRSRDALVTTDDQGQAVLAVPLVLRAGTVSGAIGLRRADGEGWDEESIALVRAVSEQVAQTLETRRLFYELSWRAQHESILRQTGERMRSQPNLDAVLQTAMREMQRITGATHVAIRLGTETQLGAAEDQTKRDEGSG